MCETMATPLNRLLIYSPHLICTLGYPCLENGVMLGRLPDLNYHRPHPLPFGLLYPEYRLPSSSVEVALLIRHDRYVEETWRARRAEEWRLTRPF